MPPMRAGLRSRLAKLRGEAMEDSATAKPVDPATTEELGALAIELRRELRLLERAEEGQASTGEGFPSPPAGAAKDR